MKLAATTIAAVSIALLAGCGDDRAANGSTGETEAASSTEPEGVGRVDEATADEETAEAEPVPAARAGPPAPIEVRSGPKGTQVSLVRAKVTGDILGIELLYKPSRSMYGNQDVISFDINQVSVTDDTTNRRYAVLRTAGNKWQASPIASNDPDWAAMTPPGNTMDPMVAWFKFPAPPPESKTVSINIPDVGPFDGITLQQ